MAMDPAKDRLVRRTAMVASVTAAYFLLTADYGPQDNALTPIKKGIESVGSSVKKFFFGQDRETRVGHQAPPRPKEPQQHGKAK